MCGLSQGMTQKLTPQDRIHASERLYGRAKGRPLSPTQVELMETVYPRVEIETSAIGAPLRGLEGYDAVWFEIGFGGSEHLIGQALAHPKVAMLGAEPFLNGVCKAVTGVNEQSLLNVRLYLGDARRVLEQLPDACLDKVIVLFPDPWPKPRHNKRRIISSKFLQEVYRVLKPGGAFRFASDIIHYVDWSLSRIQIHGGFSFDYTASEQWRERPSDWPATRYEAKAFREGRTCHYFEFWKQERV